MSAEYQGEYDIWGGDVDPQAVSIARHNAQLAGVEDLVRFEVADALTFHRDVPAGRVVTNPPYGERIMDKGEAEEPYAGFGKAWRGMPQGWSLYLPSSQSESSITECSNAICFNIWGSVGRENEETAGSAGTVHRADAVLPARCGRPSDPRIQ